MLEKFAEQVDEGLRSLSTRRGRMGVSKEGHFNQIENMIQKMLFRLKKEQTEEDDRKMWCDTENRITNDEKKEKLEGDISNLTAEIEELDQDVKDGKEKLA